MVLMCEPALKILVVGESGSTKANFINEIFCHFPSSAENHRTGASMYFLDMFYQSNPFKIQLHDVNDELKIERKFYDEMDIVFFCYAAVDPRSLQSMEKWSALMAEIKKEMVPSPPPTKKEVQSFLVVDVSNYGSQENVAYRLDEKMIDFLGIKRLIEIPFEDKESTSIAFQAISDQIIKPKAEENLLLNHLRELPENVETDRQECCQPCCTEYPDPHDFEDKNWNSEELLLLHEVSKKTMELIKDDTLSIDEAFNKLVKIKSSLKNKIPHSGPLAKEWLKPCLPKPPGFLPLGRNFSSPMAFLPPPPIQFPVAHDRNLEDKKENCERSS